MFSCVHCSFKKLRLQSAFGVSHHLHNYFSYSRVIWLLWNLTITPVKLLSRSACFSNFKLRDCPWKVLEAFATLRTIQVFFSIVTGWSGRKETLSVWEIASSTSTTYTFSLSASMVADFWNVFGLVDQVVLMLTFCCFAEVPVTSRGDLSESDHRRSFLETLKFLLVLYRFRTKFFGRRKAQIKVPTIIQLWTILKKVLSILGQLCTWE